jgi:hypothetical protein
VVERLLFCLLAVLVASVAQAADIRTRDAAGVRITTTYAWPTQLNQGYWPLQVEVSNNGEADRDIRLQLDSWYGTSFELNQRLSLAAGESAELQLLFPAFSMFSPTAELNIFVQNAKVISIAPLGPDDMNPTPSSTTIVISEDGAVSRTARRVQHDLNVHCGEACDADVMLEHLPTRYGAYTSIDTVLLDGVVPEGEAADALWAWARLGGRVAYIGDEDVLRGSPAPAAWMAPRFVEVEQDVQKSWVMGFGLLAVLSPEASGLSPSYLWGQSALTIPQSSSESSVTVWGFDDLGLVPVKAFSLLMFMVACLLGPLNFLLVRLLKRPQLLLLTTPVLATGCTLVIIVYAGFQQGLSVKQGGFAELLLDQRSHRMASRETRAFFAGLVPRDGLRPGLGTNFFPHMPGYGFRYVEWRGEGRQISGDLLPARKVSTQSVLTEQAERRRLEVSRSGGEVVVSNGLGASIEALVLWDGQQRAFALADGATLPSGNAATLSEAIGEEVYRSIQAAFQGSTAIGAAENTYVALLSGLPLSDLSGLSVELVQNQTIVWGILEEDP